MTLVAPLGVKTIETERYLRFSEPGLIVGVVELNDDGGELVDDHRICRRDLEQAGSQVVVDGDVGRDAVLAEKRQSLVSSSVGAIHHTRELMSL